MHVYTISGWRKKLRILLILLIAVLVLLIISSVYMNTRHEKTMTEDPIDQLQEDVLTQPIRVQSLPDVTMGEITS